jgi:membrane glycosyltransferase
MTSVSGSDENRAAPSSARTPAGLQRLSHLKWRRIAVGALNAATYFVLMVWLASILGAQGWSVIDSVMFLCFALAAPWSILGFWNAILGLWLLQARRDGLALAAPHALHSDLQTPLHQRTAILMTLRNEDPARAFARLAIIKRSVDATDQGALFGWFVLSDSDDPQVLELEQAAFADWQAQNTSDADRMIYRRRTLNSGYKAGNVRDFCERWGNEYEFMLPLDADSLMSGETIVRLVQMAQAHPRIGILQSLVVGAPSRSVFARVFQFGMRHAMRPYTLGSAFWAGDCGPYWGHNALVRIAPFMAHCDMPKLADGKPILSHDQIEAVLMRRAGFEVRVLPEECGSYEDNPPTLLEFTKRDTRWCQGNLQYLKLLDLPALEPMSRFQLIWAIAMFLGLPAFTLMIALVAFKPLDGESLALFPTHSALAFYLVFLLMYLSPKLAGFLDIAFTPGAMARYGGAVRFTSGVIVEIIFAFLLGAISTFRTSLFMLGLVMGRSVTWNGQSRDAHALPFAIACAGLWPQLLFGLIVNGLFLHWSLELFLWALPLTAGYLLAIPFAILTADPKLGERMTQWGLCALPEEINPPEEIASLAEIPSAAQRSV